MLKRALLVALVISGSACAALSAEDAAQTKATEAAAALQRGNPQLAATLYTDALRDVSLSNDRRAGLMSDRAVAYARMDQLKLAIDDYNRAVQLYPEFPAAYNNRGNLLLSLGLTREAIKDFDRAIVLAPGYAAAYNNRASAAMKLGQVADAVRDYTKAIQLMPANAAPLGGRGRAHLALARPHAALRDFTRALQADARFAEGYRARAEAKLAIDLNEEAAEDLSRAIAFDPKNAEYHVLRGQAYLQAKSLASAIKDFSRALEIDERSAAAYEGRGLANARAEAFGEAEADIAKALEIDPRSALAYAYRAWFYKQMGQPEIAMKEVEKAARLDAQRGEVQWVKGEIEEALGKNQDAVASYRRALERVPGLADAAEGLERLGGDAGVTDDAEVPGSALQRWRVLVRNGRYFAVSDELPKLRVPLEMLGAGQPRLIEWALQPPPHKGIGLLTYAAGTLAGKAGEEAFEQIAIVDTLERKVIGIQPHRQGDKLSTWTWDEGKVTIASVDGVTDEFMLRSQRLKEIAAAPRRVTSVDPWKNGIPGWAPWAPSGWGYPPDNRGGNRPRQKPKSLFDLLFGN